jgi:three-Cys-motif partner protein
MPVINGVGFSDSTDAKQKHFGIIIKTHLKATCHGILNKYQQTTNNPYLYFNMESGPGVYNGAVGSPIIFMDEAAKYESNQFDIFLFEKNPANCDALQNNINIRKYPSNLNVQILTSDSSVDILNHVPANGYPRYGLVYSDPTGTVPPFDTLGQISNIRQCARLDFLINFAATTIKRVRGSHLCHQTQSLKDHLSAINKKHWMVRDPQSKHQWSFVIGSNWADFPAFKNQGFHPVNSIAGKMILDYLNYTKNEKRIGRIRQCRQLSLNF